MSPIPPSNLQPDLDATSRRDADPETSLDRRVIRTSAVLWILGIVFSLFLCSLGTQGLSDAADLFSEPQLETYADPRVAAIREERFELEASSDPRQTKIQNAERDLEDLDRAVTTATASFRNWLDTRATLGDTTDDTKVRERRDRLDELRTERDGLAHELERLRREPDPRIATRQSLDEREAAAMKDAEGAYRAAHRTWTWKVLAARFGLIFPVWIVAIVLWRRRERIPYVTLLWGYWAFAVWMLVWGIGPYLPRYGGYVPLGAGTAITVWGSVTLVRWFNRRAKRRRKRIVDQAIGKHRCPGCDHDYLLGREVGLDVGLGRKANVLRYDDEALHPRRCANCGLRLFAPCGTCEHMRLVHQERCAFCGATELGESGATETSETSGDPSPA